jgi:hypothetical protein
MQMEEQIRLVWSHESCEDPELTLVLLLWLGHLRGWISWFTPTMSAHWKAIRNLNCPTELRQSVPYSTRALHLLLDNHQIREATNLIIDCNFTLDASVLDRIYSMSPYAAKLCLSAPHIVLDKDSIGELTDWVIAHFDYRDSWLFVRFFEQDNKDYQSLEKIITHAPEALKYLSDNLTHIKSKRIVEMFIFYGAHQKLHPYSFNLEGLPESVSNFRPKYDADKLPVEASWLADQSRYELNHETLEAHSLAFREDFWFYCNGLGRYPDYPLAISNDIPKMQKIYDNDSKQLVLAAIHRGNGQWTITQDSAQWFVSHYDASNLYLFACLFQRCEALEGAASILRHAPLLLKHISRWSLERSDLTELLEEYGACHKIKPRPGKGDAYNHVVKVHDYITDRLTANFSDNDRELLLESRYPIPPYLLAYQLYRREYWPQLEGYLQEQTVEYREEYEACREMLFAD